MKKIETMTETEYLKARAKARANQEYQALLDREERDYQARLRADREWVPEYRRNGR